MASYYGHLIVICHNQDRHVTHYVHIADNAWHVGIGIGKLRLASLFWCVSVSWFIGGGFVHRYWHSVRSADCGDQVWIQGWDVRLRTLSQLPRSCPSPDE